MSQKQTHRQILCAMLGIPDSVSEVDLIAVVARLKLNQDGIRNSSHRRFQQDLSDLKSAAIIAERFNMPGSADLIRATIGGMEQAAMIFNGKEIL